MKANHLLLFGAAIGILYGMYNMLIPITTVGFPNLPFPFQPTELVWFDGVHHIDWLYDPWTRAFYDPDWLVWSLTLYISVTLPSMLVARSVLRRHNLSFDRCSHLGWILLVCVFPVNYLC